MILYRQHFGDCGNLEPDGGFFVEYEDKCYCAPKEETPEKFKQRLKRSIELGENLFVKEYVGPAEKGKFYFSCSFIQPLVPSATIFLPISRLPACTKKGTKEGAAGA